VRASPTSFILVAGKARAMTLAVAGIAELLDGQPVNAKLTPLRRPLHLTASQRCRFKIEAYRRFNFGVGSIV